MIFTRGCSRHCFAGEGLRGIAELAAEEAGEPIAIVLPARGLAGASV